MINNYKQLLLLFIYKKKLVGNYFKLLRMYLNDAIKINLQNIILN